LPFTTYNKAVTARVELRTLVRDLIDRRRTSAPEVVTSKDMLQAMLDYTDEDGTKLNDDEILNNLLMILFSSIDTTGSLIGSLLFLLQKHERVRMFKVSLKSIAVSCRCFISFQSQFLMGNSVCSFILVYLVACIIRARSFMQCRNLV
jgi:hypothetical protein